MRMSMSGMLMRMSRYGALGASAVLVVVTVAMLVVMFMAVVMVPPVPMANGRYSRDARHDPAVASAFSSFS